MTDLADLETQVNVHVGNHRRYQPNPWGFGNTARAVDLMRGRWHEATQRRHRWYGTAEGVTVMRRVKLRRCYECQTKRPTEAFPDCALFRGASFAIGSKHRPVCYACRIGGAALTRQCWRCGDTFAIPHGLSERRWCSHACQSAGQRLGSAPTWVRTPYRVTEPDELPAFRALLCRDRTIGRNGRSYPARQAAVERDKSIRELRAEGLSVRQIAERAGCSVGTVHRVVKGVQLKCAPRCTFELNGSAGQVSA